MKTKAAVVLAVVVGLMFGAQFPALAHDMQAGQYVYWTPNSNCTAVDTVLRHSGAQNTVTSKSWFNEMMWDCAGTLTRAPGFIKANTIYVGKNNDGSWGVCAEAGWIVNPSNSWNLTQNTSFPGGNPAMCGAREYAVHAHGYVSVNNTWYGGFTPTPTHWFQ